MKVVLYQPQIPQNTGSIVRICSVTGTGLILIPPLGFSITDRWLKRAGLDYWEGVEMTQCRNPEELFASHSCYFFSSKATQLYTDVKYGKDDLLVFGSETSGLPSEFFARWPDRFVTIPMLPQARCLNLAVSVGIGVYEAYRQCGL